MKTGASNIAESRTSEFARALPVRRPFGNALETDLTRLAQETVQ